MAARRVELYSDADRNVNAMLLRTSCFGSAAVVAGLALGAPPPADEPPAARCLAAGRASARWALPTRFREVSGLAASPDGTLFLHDDEQGVIGVFDPAAGKVTAAYQLGPLLARGDFEGIAVGGGRVFVTTSDGILYDTPLPKPGLASGTQPVSRNDTGIGSHCEIEGLAFDPRANLLLFACKTPRKRKLEGQLTIYRWSVAAGRLAEPKRIEIPLAQLGARFNESFRSSSIEVDPRTGDLVLISSADHGYVVLDPAGRVTASGPLPGRHRQPEGLAILPDGRMFISDEGGRGPGTITLYACAKAPGT